MPDLRGTRVNLHNHHCENLKILLIFIYVRLELLVDVIIQIMIFLVVTQLIL
jgi:hypothetical protein